ncbi:MAG: small basic protein [Planctomycetes bacterium]|nr:small basic protein [Planctomycetota bacterium]
MTIHKSLVLSGKLKRHRNVLSRAERLAYLGKEGKWKEANSVFGLMKVKNIKPKAKKAAKKEEAAAAAPGAVPVAGAAPAAAGAPAKAGAVPAKGAAPAAAAPKAGAKDKPAAKK